MDCCVLSQEECARLQHYGIQPSHKEHHHMNSEAAIKGVQDDSLILVELGDGRYAVTPVKLYFLQRRNSGGLDTIQRVISNHITELKPIR